MYKLRKLTFAAFTHRNNAYAQRFSQSSLHLVLVFSYPSNHPSVDLSIRSLRLLFPLTFSPCNIKITCAISPIKRYAHRAKCTHIIQHYIFSDFYFCFHFKLIFHTHFICIKLTQKIHNISCHRISAKF